MGKKSTPTPPDLSSLSNAQLEISRQQLAQAQQQMNMSQSQFNKFVDQTNLEMQQSQKQYDTQMQLQNRALDQADAAAAVSKSVADKQIAAMDQNMGFAQEDRARYKDTFIPMQDNFIAEAKGYDTPARREQAASQALADNQTQIEAQRSNTAAQLAAMGVDPSQVMSTSLANQMGVAGAATGAMNANNSRLQVEDRGRSLMAQAIDMGNGLPAQSQAGYNVASNSGQTAANASANATGGFSTASGIGATGAGIRQSSLNTASSITGSPMAWAQLGNQSYGGASNGIMNSSSIQNQQFQNQMSAQKMKNDQAAATMNAIGSVASIAGMAMMAEGGVVGQVPRTPAPGYSGGIMPPNMQHPGGAMGGRMAPPVSMGGGMAPAPMQMPQPQQGGMMNAPVQYGAPVGGYRPHPAYTTHLAFTANGAQRFMAEGGSVGGMPPIHWSDLDKPHVSAPAMGMQISNAPQQVKALTAHVPLSGAGKWGQALSMASSMPGLGGGDSGPAPDPNLQQDWLHPIMRAEGGPIGYYAEGGAMGGHDQPGSQYKVMPNMQSRDMIPVMLSPGEIVVPADVARIKGQEFFDKLIQKHHRPGA